MVTFILRDELTLPFVDDVSIKGPSTRYELPNGTFETVTENPGIRRFVWEYFNDVARIVQRVRHAGGTFSGPKVQLCIPEVTIVGHLCTNEGRRPVLDRIQKITNWPIPKNLTGVRGFLGTVGTLRMFIKDFAVHAAPLFRLTRRKSEFDFGTDQLPSMETLKTASYPSLSTLHTPQAGTR
jgi:hypothetical protein